MSNLFSNRVSASLTAAALADIKDGINTLRNQMPFLLGLTQEERMSIPKINEANRVFTADALVAVQNNAAMLPAYFTSSELKLDLDLYHALDEVELLLSQLTEAVNDTRMLAGSEAYISALTSYRLFRAAANAGVPGADAVFESLRSRFQNQGGGADPQPELDDAA